MYICLSIIQGHSFMHRHDIYTLTHTSPVVGRVLISNITTAHIASIGVGTMLIASTYTRSTFISVCVVGSCTHETTCTFVINDTESYGHAQIGYILLPTQVLLLEEI